MDTAIEIFTGFLAGVGACFSQYPTGTFIVMAIAMIMTMTVATLRKVA